MGNPTYTPHTDSVEESDSVPISYGGFWWRLDGEFTKVLLFERDPVGAVAFSVRRGARLPWAAQTSTGFANSLRFADELAAIEFVESAIPAYLAWRAQCADKGSWYELLLTDHRPEDMRTLRCSSSGMEKGAVDNEVAGRLYEA